MAGEAGQSKCLLSSFQGRQQHMLTTNAPGMLHSLPALSQKMAPKAMRAAFQGQAPIIYVVFPPALTMPCQEDVPYIIETWMLHVRYFARISLTIPVLSSLGG